VSRARATHRRGPVLVHEHQPSPFKRECQGISGHTCTNRVGTGQDSATRHDDTRPHDRRTARPAMASSPPPRTRRTTRRRPHAHARARPRRNHATTRNTPPTAPVQTTRQPHDRATTRPRSQPRHAPRTGARGPVASIAPSVPAGLGHEPACVHGHGTHGLGSSPPHSPMLHRHCIGMGMGTAHHSHTHERGHAALLLSPAMPCLNGGQAARIRPPRPGFELAGRRGRAPPGEWEPAPSP
jgi:hypothetical protein